MSKTNAWVLAFQFTYLLFYTMFRLLVIYVEAENGALLHTTSRLLHTTSRGRGKWSLKGDQNVKSWKIFREKSVWIVLQFAD